MFSERVTEFLVDYTAFIALALLIGVVIILATLPRKNMTSREITICAMSIAMSLVLSIIKISPVPNGGSITLAAIVPLVIYAYLAGPVRGVAGAFVYSILQVLQEPYVVGFFQLLLDYILPFTAFGLVGFLKPLREKEWFRNLKLGNYDLIVMVILVYLFRYFAHVISGVLYWGVPWGGSFVYNATYIPLDLFVALVTLFALIKTRTITRLQTMYNGQSIKTASTTELD